MSAQQHPWREPDGCLLAHTGTELAALQMDSVLSAQPLVSLPDDTCTGASVWSTCGVHGGDVDGATDRLLRSSFAWVFEPTPRGEAVHFRWEPKAAFAGGSRLIAVEEEQDVAFGVAFGKLLYSDHAWAFQLGPGVPLAPFTWRPKAAFEREEGWRVCGRRRSWSGWAPALLQQARRRAAWLGLVVASAEATTWPLG